MPAGSCQDIQSRTVTHLFFSGIAEVDASKARFTLVSFAYFPPSVQHELTDIYVYTSPLIVGSCMVAAIFWNNRTSYSSQQ